MAGASQLRSRRVQRVFRVGHRHEVHHFAGPGLTFSSVVPEMASRDTGPMPVAVHREHAIVPSECLGPTCGQGVRPCKWSPCCRVVHPSWFPTRRPGPKCRCGNCQPCPSAARIPSSSTRVVRPSVAVWPACHRQVSPGAAGQQVMGGRVSPIPSATNDCGQGADDGEVPPPGALTISAFSFFYSFDKISLSRLSSG